MTTNTHVPNKQQKQTYITEMTAQFENSEAVLVTHYQG